MVGKPSPARNNALLSELDERVTGLEYKMDTVVRDVAKMVVSHDTIKGNMNEFQMSVMKISDSVGKIQLFESELRMLREKLLTYEGKFQSLEDLKKLVWATILAVLPGSIAVISQVIQFFMTQSGR